MPDEDIIYEFESTHKMSSRRIGNIILNIVIIFAGIVGLLISQLLIIDYEGLNSIIIWILGTISCFYVIFLIASELLILLGSQKVRIMDNGLSIIRNPLFRRQTIIQIRYSQVEVWKITKNKFIFISYKDDLSIEYLTIRRNEVEDFDRIQSILSDNMIIPPTSKES